MKRWLRILLQLLGVVLFVAIAWWAGAESWRQVLRGRPGPLLASALLTGAAQVLSATRLQLMSRTVTGRRLGGWRAFYILTMTAQVLGLVLPRGVSAMGGKAVGLRTMGATLTRSAWIVLLDSGFDVGLLLLLSVPGLLLLRGSVATAPFLLLYGVAFATAALLIWLVAWWRPWELLARPLGRVPRFGARLQARFLEGADLFPTPRPALLLLLLTFVINGLLALRFYAIGLALLLPAGWPVFLAAFPMTQLSLVVALAPGGLGVFELGWVGLLRLAGIGEATTFAVAQRAYTTIINLFWAGVAYLLSLSLRRGPSSETPQS